MSEVTNGQEFKDAIIEEAKKKGLDLAEETVVQAVEVIFDIAPRLTGLIKNPTIKLIASGLAGGLVLIKPQVLEWVDKIDGEDDPEY